MELHITKTHSLILVLRDARGKIKRTYTGKIALLRYKEYIQLLSN